MLSKDVEVRVWAPLLGVVLLSSVLWLAGCEGSPAGDGSHGDAGASVSLPELSALRGRVLKAVPPPSAPTGFATRAGADELAPIATAFQDATGPGVFIRMGGLSPVGQALFKRLGELEEQGLDPDRFGMPNLGEDLERWIASSGGSTTDLGVGEVDGAAELMLWLRWAEPVSGSALSKRVAGISVGPEMLSALEASLAKTHNGPTAAQLEARLGRALMQWVIEFRFALRTGPVKVTSPRTLVRDHRDAIVAVMAKIARSGDPGRALDALAPSTAAYGRLVKAYGHYRTLVASGGCKELPAKWRYPTTTGPGPEVRRLQERLACEGYLDGKPDGVYDSRTMDAVRKYQEHHDIRATGAAMEVTVRSLNVPITRRAAQIRLALMRLREERTAYPGDHIVVNLPAFELRAMDGDNVIRRQRVIVGTNKLDDDKVKLVQGHINRTRLMETKLYEVVANPDWILPPRVHKGELVGKIKKNSSYLKDNNIREVTLPNGKAVMVQGPGKGNALGKVKFLLEGSNAIFLHDTNDRFLFRKSARAFSHGCVRVDKAVDFAQWLLERDGWDGREVRRALKAKSVQRGMPLHTPVPLAMRYHSVEIAPSGLPVFYADIYGYDAAFFSGKIPVEETIRWGHARLRPRWVPRVDEKVVEGWRAASKPAPRDYKP